MKLISAKLNQIIGSNNFLNILFSICFALASTLIIKAKAFPSLLIGRGFEVENLFLRVSLFLFYFVSFIIVYFFFQWIYKIFVSITKPKRYKMETIEKEDKSYKKVTIAIIIISLGILIIYMITNVIARIDTNEWQLKSLDIIPSTGPIGNDFRVGLYTPASNLWKSGFKAISPDGNYPSIYPPLVNILSMPFLLFDDQTAYLINIGILIICNLVCLLIATLMIKELFLEKIIKEKLISLFLSIFLFTSVSIYNFSSYAFLFSIERGNVDAIAMFYAMLSLWVLLRQPQKIWLQVILLSVATHYKIYPAVLFLVLFYSHGKKMILPMLATNLAFLFISGPEIAGNFLQSVASSGKGAGIGNNYSWIGNHAAYSFATMLTQRYPRFEKSFFDLWTAAMLVPFAIWIQGCVRIIRNKYSAMNSVLLLMISIPMMVILPTISHDYRLIILSISLLLYIGLIIYQILLKSGWEKIAELLILMIIMFFIAKPYDIDPNNLYVLKETSSFYLNNKYVWAVALEGIMVWNVIKSLKNEYPIKVN